MKLLLKILPALTVLAIVYCGGNQIAGSKGGSETTNGITVCVVHSDGSAAKGCAVHLRKAAYVCLAAKTDLNNVNKMDTVTDSLGRFIVKGIDTGSYCIEVTDSSISGNSAVLLRCRVGDSDTVNLGIETLTRCASVSGHLDIGSADAQKYHVIVKGLEHVQKTDECGNYSFSNLPAGSLDFVVVGSGNTETVSEILNVNAISGDTVSISSIAGKLFSGNIYINTTSSGAAITDNVTDFPLAVKFDSATFNFSTAGADGNDIVFTKANGDVLPCDVELWDAAGKRAVVWVNIDTIYSGRDDQHIIMHWGDLQNANRTTGSGVFDTADGFAAVWHMNDDPQSGEASIMDRTVNGYNGTPSSSMTSASVVSGKIGNALNFNGVSDSIDAGQLDIGSRYSMSLWINAADLRGKSKRFIWKDSSYTFWYDATGYGVRAEHFTDSLVWRGMYQDGSHFCRLDTAEWYYLSVTYDGEKIRLFVNGNLSDSTENISDIPRRSSKPLSIGGRSDEFVKGIIDEVRIERVARSAVWIKLCYLSQKQGGIAVDFRR